MASPITDAALVEQFARGNSQVIEQETIRAKDTTADRTRQERPLTSFHTSIKALSEGFNRDESDIRKWFKDPKLWLHWWNAYQRDGLEPAREQARRAGKRITTGVNLNTVVAVIKHGESYGIGKYSTASDDDRKTFDLVDHHAWFLYHVTRINEVLRNGVLYEKSDWDTYKKYHAIWQTRMYQINMSNDSKQGRKNKSIQDRLIQAARNIQERSETALTAQAESASRQASAAQTAQSLETARAASQASDAQTTEARSQVIDSTQSSSPPARPRRGLFGARGRRSVTPTATGLRLPDTAHPSRGRGTTTAFGGIRGHLGNIVAPDFNHLQEQEQFRQQLTATLPDSVPTIPTESVQDNATMMQTPPIGELADIRIGESEGTSLQGNRMLDSNEIEGDTQPHDNDTSMEDVDSRQKREESIPFEWQPMDVVEGQALGTAGDPIDLVRDEDPPQNTDSPEGPAPPPLTRWEESAKRQLAKHTTFGYHTGELLQSAMPHLEEIFPNI